MFPGKSLSQCHLVTEVRGSLLRCSCQAQYESLVLPCNVPHNRSVTDWPHEGPVLRLHIGLEDTEDLIADLQAGFARMRDAGYLPWLSLQRSQ